MLKIEVHHHVHLPETPTPTHDPTRTLLEDIQKMLRQVLTNQQMEDRRMATQLEHLNEVAGKIQHLEDVGDGMEVLLGTLSQQIAALRTGDPAVDAKLNDLAMGIQTKTDEWSAALVANTPADPNAGGGTSAGGGGTTDQPPTTTDQAPATAGGQETAG